MQRPVSCSSLQEGVEERREGEGIKERMGEEAGMVLDETLRSADAIVWMVGSH